MSVTSIETKSEFDQSPEPRQRLLELARSLDRMGRQSEEFLCAQLQQLADALDEFDREKAAWRRQLRRESAELARQRDEIEHLRAALASGSSSVVCDSATRRRAAAESAARKSGDAPFRMIVQPRNASPLQVSVLFFEISKLNRDMGGKGVRFEASDVRVPRRKLLSRQNDAESNWPVFEFNGFPTDPLKARGSHVALEADNTDRVEQWIAFKSRVLQTVLANGELAKESRKLQSVNRTPEIWAFIREASRRPGTEASWADDSFVAPFNSQLPGLQVECVLQQVLRLESCFERLCHDTGLRADVVA